jgi:glycosyltransferase involved in cell wall biosynthesis
VTPPVPAPGRWHYRLAYRLAWSARSALRPIVPPAVRQRARAALISRAFPPVTPPSAPPAAAAPAGTLPWGLSVIGYVKAESGVGESARATLRALARTDVPHALVDFRVGNVSRMGEQIDERVATGQRHAISLFHVNADQLPVARAHLDDAWFTVPHRIGYWAWELENFPPQWHDAFAHVDEVWVPSSFCQNAVAAVSPVPVLCIPHAIEIPERVTPDRARFGLRDDSVVFLSMADMMSVAERKNPLGAVQAFVEAFAPDDARAEMVVKVSNPQWDPAAFERLRTLAAAHPGVHLLADYLDRPALNTLLDSVDVYVSLHRSEGFGLGIAEAMARGKVALATGWSGNMDFMNAHNALTVDYRLVRLEADAGPYRRGERWATPSIDDAVTKMRQIAVDAALRARLGERARADCRLQLAPDVVGARIAARLQAIRHAKGL